jgi:hypothetical protein
MRENERPTLLSRRQILAAGVAVAGAMPFLTKERAAAAPEPRTGGLRVTAGTRTLAVNGNRREYLASPGRTENPALHSRLGSAFTSIL